MISDKASVPRFNIILISINQHKLIFEDMIIAMQAAIKDLGFTCTRTENVYVDGAVNIVIGSVMFASKAVTDALGNKPFVLYQMEQLASDRGHLPNYPHYIHLMKNASVIWDYSHTNIERLAQLGFNGVIHVPAGYHKALEVVRHAQPKDIDVLFFGTRSPRREHIIRALHARGIKVVAATGVYGGERNALIAGSKIVLNLHCADIDTLEEVRLSFLLSNRCFVISELADHNPYGDGVAFCPYDRLVETCEQYLQAGEAVRKDIADKGYQAIRKLDYTPAIKTALQKMRLL
jgi:hypothetical protein